MRVPIAIFATLAIALAGVVHAAAIPMDCEVDARSPQGGRVWMTRFDHNPKMPFDLPPRIGWQPPSSANRFVLAVGFDTSAEKAPGDPTGGHLTFTPQVKINTDRYSVRVTAGTGQIWTFGQGDLTFGAEQADILIERDDLRGRAIIAAISHGTRLRVDILLDGKIEQYDTFDPSNIGERDKLMAYARHLVETNDPRVCKAF